jgi:structural maintenance of chromosomes protein 5
LNLKNKEKELNKLEDLDEVNEKMKDLNTQKKEIEKQVNQFEQQLKSMQREIKKKNSEIRNEKESLKEITDIQSKKLRTLEKYDRYGDLKRAWKWVKEQTFEKPVLGPILVELGCKSAQHGQWIENSVGARFKELFVAQTSRDFSKLQRKNAQSKGGSMNICLVENSKSSARYNFSGSRLNKLKTLGILGTLDQTIVTSAPIMQALRTQCGVQNILVGDNTAEKNFEEITKILRQDKNFKSCRILTPRFSYYVRVSRYGARNTTTQSNTLLPYKQLIGKGMDETKAKTVRDNIARLETELGELEDELREIKNEYETSSSKQLKIVEKLKPLREVKKNHSKLTRTVKTLKDKIERLEEEIESFDIATMTKKLNKIVEKLYKKRTERFLEATKIAVKQATYRRSHMMYHLETSKFKAHADMLNADLKVIKEEEDSLRVTYEDAETTTLRLLKDMKLKKKEAVRSCDGMDPRSLHKTNNKLFKKFNKLREEALDVLKMTKSDTPTIIEIRDGVELLITEVERTAMLKVADEEILVKYEERVHLIDKYKRELVQVEADFESKNSSLDRKASDWRTKIRAVCQRINNKFGEYMKKMGAKGEVVLEEHADFAQWHVVIKVAFRDSNKLQQLVRTRQSGGEKTVSTMLYVVVVVVVVLSLSLSLSLFVSNTHTHKICIHVFQVHSCDADHVSSTI